MTPREAINFIDSEVQIDVRFCSDEKIEKTKQAFELAKYALDKQIPKKLIVIENEKCCPVCEEGICNLGDDGNYGDYCLGCGQALDWSDTE